MCVWDLDSLLLLHGVIAFTTDRTSSIDRKGRYTIQQCSRDLYRYVCQRDFKFNVSILMVV